MPSPDQRLCDQSRQHRIEIKALGRGRQRPDQCSALAKPSIDRDDSTLLGISHSWRNYGG
jgi:hypothetical protein